jgi:thiol-disulfide isomerase/thioredoxin
MTTLDSAFLETKHSEGDDYETYLAKDPSRIESWRDIEKRLELSSTQEAVLNGFTRSMKVLCLSGTWCGDCVVQCPMIECLASACDQIDLRWLDRDEHDDLADQVKINAGLRVPTVVFCSEDFELIGSYGDRTLTRYRAIAAKQLGAACPLPGAHVPEDELNATMQDWLNEFERVQLLLRLSPRLRQKYGD